MKTPRAKASESILVIVDVQDKLLTKIPNGQTLVRNIGFLADVAALLDVPVLATEQYPKGLGATTAELARRLPPELPSKTAFSCCGAAEFCTQLRDRFRQSVVLVGIETHVCMAQTALDLIELGHSVFLPVDASAARHSLDHDIALRRLERAGVTLTTCEAVAFEWTADAAHPRFKMVSQLVIARDASH